MSIVDNTNCFTVQESYKDMSYYDVTFMTSLTDYVLSFYCMISAILKWTGNMDCGVHRQDLLILLCETIQDSDACNWGAQCNRAIRLVFPNIDMKRKGKYKTYPFS